MLPHHPSPAALGFRLARTRLAARSRQCGTRISRDRCGRALLGRHRLAERRLGDRVRGDRGSVAFAEGRSGLRRFARVRARHRRRRRLRGAIKFAVLPALQTFPAFCAALGLFYLPAGFAMARDPAASSVRRVHRHGLQLHASPRAHQPDELRHRAILQLRARDRRRLRRRTAGIPPVAAVVAGSSRAPPARLDLARHASPRDRSRPSDTGLLGGPDLRPARGIA